jgi:hypothetical protein
VVITTVTCKRRKNTSKVLIFPPLLDLLSSGFSLSLGSLVFLLQVKRPGRQSPDRIRLTNLALPSRRVDLKTPLDDRVDLLFSLRFF